MHSRHSIRLDFRIQRPLVSLRYLLMVIVPLIAAASDGAELFAQADVPAAAQLPIVSDTGRPPITPKRAFFSSLLAPGSAQNVLGRHRAAAALLAVEVISIAMIRESGADLREARLQRGDSLVLSYVDESGARLATPTLRRRRFEDVEVRSRRSHIEDWVALLIANHLFAASDAFVAANLWDVAAHVTIRGSRDRVLIGTQLSW